MTAEPVTVKCVYCRREIDGHFINGKDTIVKMDTGKVLAVVGVYNKRTGYMHQACKTGIEAEEALQTK